MGLACGTGRVERLPHFPATSIPLPDGLFEPRGGRGFVGEHLEELHEGDPLAVGFARRLVTGHEQSLLK